MFELARCLLCICSMLAKIKFHRRHVLLMIPICIRFAYEIIRWSYCWAYWLKPRAEIKWNVPPCFLKYTRLGNIWTICDYCFHKWNNNHLSVFFPSWVPFFSNFCQQQHYIIWCGFFIISCLSMDSINKIFYIVIRDEKWRQVQMQKSAGKEGFFSASFFCSVDEFSDLALSIEHALISIFDYTVSALIKQFSLLLLSW